MSNTSVISPVAAVTVGCIGGVVMLAKWLAEETPEEQFLNNRLKEEKRRERLGSRLAEKLEITTMSLHIKDVEPLVHSAEKLGYRLEPLANPMQPLKNQAQILLRKASGERLGIAYNEEGRLVVGTAGEKTCMNALVKQHNVDRAMEYLSKTGMDIQTAKLSNGELQILAQPGNMQSSSKAEIRAQVRTDGSIWVDIEKVKGNQCEKIVTQLAHAIGGIIIDMKKKDSYFQLPIESIKKAIKV